MASIAWIVYLLQRINSYSHKYFVQSHLQKWSKPQCNQSSLSNWVTSCVRVWTCLSCAICAWWQLWAATWVLVKLQHVLVVKLALQALLWVGRELESQNSAKGTWARDCTPRGEEYVSAMKWWVKLTASLSKPILSLFPGFSVLLLLDTNLQTWYKSYLSSAYLNLTVGTCQRNERYSLWMWPSFFCESQLCSEEETFWSLLGIRQFWHTDCLPVWLRQGAKC